MVTKLTREGFEQLEQELYELSNIRRKEIAEKLRETIDNHDYEDITELDMVRTEQAFVEGRILTLQSILASAQILEKPVTTDVVDLGSWVTIKEGSETFEYLLVNPAEANPAENKISFQSPIGKAIMNKKVGDVVKVRTPDGETQLEVIKIG
ncbi:MAG: transcription elongation factor GreA [Anaerolineaceae bacterium]|nr:transcription elongation factor GreA [Anaerolineaceae bacterium]